MTRPTVSRRCSRRSNAVRVSFILETGDADDSQVFSDLKMNPTELTDIVRRRRDVKSNDESSRRRKRALSPYDFYDADSVRVLSQRLQRPLFFSRSVLRSLRRSSRANTIRPSYSFVCVRASPRPFDDLILDSFRPVYWYPSMYERNVRSALPSSFFEPLQDSRAYSDSEDTDDSDESPGRPTFTVICFNATCRL